MSGIAGIFRRDGEPVSKQRVQDMVRAIDHRGPDGTCTRTFQNIGLGHCLMSFGDDRTDGRQPQPLVEKDKGLAVTCDANIYNIDEINKKIGKRYKREKNTSNASLIIESYKKWGKKCAKHIKGDYSFVVFDRSLGEAICGRDVFGVKPFYYYLDNEYFIFCSECAGILQDKKVKTKVSKKRIADMFGLFHDDTEESMFEYIKRLAPSNIMSVGRKNFNKKRYWRLEDKELKISSVEEYVHVFKRKFEDAVGSRVKNSSQPGAFLSGGLDSSSVVCTLEDQLSEDQRPLKTFSGVYGSVPKADESNYIEEVVDKVESKSYFVEADKISTLSWYHKYKKEAKYREPLFGANGRVNIHIHEMAKSKGVDVLFDGFDGDTTVSHGIGKINKIIINNKFIEAAKNIYRISEMYGMSFPSMLYSYIESFKLNNIPGYKRVKALFKKAVGGGGISQGGAWLNSEFSSQVDWYERKKKHIDHKYHFVKSEKESHYNRLMSGVMVWSNEMRDAASQLAGVEVRMPFWDRELVELSYNIPSDLKLRNGWSRWILRSAMDEKVPKKVRWRRDKANLGYGFEYVLKNIDIEYIRQAILSPSYIDKYANMEKLENSLRRLKESKATFDELNGLHRATSMELWLQLNE